MGANDIRWVNPDPNIGADDLNPPRGLSEKYPWLTIQFSVIQLAKINGGTLNVMVGQYNENVDMQDKKYSDIKLVGQIATQYSLDKAAEFCEERPVVDGQQKESVFRIAKVTGVSIQNLNIRNGKADWGGGLLIEEAQVDIIQCCIHDNQAKGGGGGGFAYLACDKGSAKVDKCLIYHNFAYLSVLNPQQQKLAKTGIVAPTTSLLHGKGLNGTGAGGVVDETTDLKITSCRIYDNRAQGTGGGLRIRNSHKITVSAACQFHDNRASDGGAVAISECPDVPASIQIVDNNVFQKNRAGNHGGAALIGDFSYVTIKKCEFTDNRADWCGGAVAIRQGEDSAFGRQVPIDVIAEGAAGKRVDISDCEFKINSTEFPGGALYVLFSSYVKIDNTLFEKNTAGASGFGEGGAIYSDDNCAVEVRDESKFVENSTKDCGGAIAAVNSHLLIRAKCSFTNNGATAGGAIFVRALGQATDTTQIQYYKKSNFTPARLEIDGHNVFTDNHATFGGAINGLGSDAFLPIAAAIANGNQFTTNKATSYDGGAFDFSDIHEASITGENEFKGNTAAQFGGAGSIALCERLVLKNNLKVGFSDNTAQWGGGALFLRTCSSMTIMQNKFANDAKAPALWFVECKNKGSSAASYADPLNPGLTAAEIKIENPK